MEEREPKKISSFLGDEICNMLPVSFPQLYRRITYIILKFLQSDEKILFVQFPIEELTNDISKKDEYWTEMCDVIAYAIRLSMKSGELQPSECSYPGNWYKEDDKFLLFPSEDDVKNFYPYFFLNVEKNKDKRDNVKMNFRCINPNFGTRASNKSMLIQNARALYELNELPLQIENGFNKCRRELELLKCNKFNNEQFSSAIAICPASSSLKYAGKYINPIVGIYNANAQYPESDLVTIVGDYAFGQIQRAISALTPYGTTQKLLVFGTLPTEYLAQQHPLTLSLSFREIHGYCAPENVEYFDPEFIEIEFPWLQNNLKNLQSILDKYAERLSGQVSKYIKNFSRKFLANIEFNEDKLKKFKECFEDFIYQQIDEESLPEVYNDILDWASCLSYESSTNPKKEYAQKISARIVHSHRSIQRQLRSLENYGNLLVLDAPYHGKHNDSNPISNVMRYHLFPKLECLYYTEIETPIMEGSKVNLSKDSFYLSQEINTDSSESCNSEIEEIVSLEDYFEMAPCQREYFIKVYDQESVSFTDGSQEQLSGDVLMMLENRGIKRIPFADILEKERLTITYYSQNSTNKGCFDKLVNALYEFPEDKNIDYYVEVWQKAFKKLIESFNDEDLKKFYKNFNISEAVCKNHISGNSKFMQPDKFNRILKFLVDKELLDVEVVKYIMAARRFMSRNNISFGLNLKDALYRYRINDKDISEFFRKVLSKTDLSPKDIMERFLYTKTIKLS